MKQKIAYLTIDDGPSKDMKKKVKFLVSKKIPAVWFCVGKNIEKRTSLVIYAIKKGFIIGNHSYNHLLFSNLTLKQCFEEIRKTDRIIDVIYKKAGVERPVKFFRFPNGDKGGLKYEEVFEPYNGKGKIRKEKIQEFLRNLGYMQPKFENITYNYYKGSGLLKDVDWHWTYDCFEYTIYEPRHIFGIDNIEKVYARMEENFPEGCRGLNYSGSDDIILIHDMENTTHLFKPIIERLLSKGIVFKMPKLN